MSIRMTLSVAALAVAAGWVSPAAAQGSDTLAVQQEIAAMRAQMAAMAQRIDTLEAQLATAKAESQASTAAVAARVDSVAAAKSESPVEVAWKGAPEVTGKGGWSFKPRGRMQIDAGHVSRPGGLADRGLGFGSEMRRAYLGFEGTIPGGFGYRAEVDVAASNVEVTDFYLTYKVSDPLLLTVGHQKPFWSMEDQVSDLFTSFTERAAFNGAFGFERRIGVSGTFAKGPVLIQAGAFTDNIADLNDDENSSKSFDGRAVFMPKLAGGQLHLGGSAHWRDLGGTTGSVRYRARPFVHTSDTRFIDTGNLTASGETAYGLEAAFLRGPFHFASEAHWQKVRRPGLADPTFFGAYAEAGIFLTRGDTRGYKNGVFDRVKPANGFDKGGIGAIQVNVRYDYLDLVDAGVAGGSQDGYEIALVWTPTAYTRLMANYGRLQFDQAAIALPSGDRSYGVDTFGMRAQVDF